MDEQLYAEGQAWKTEVAWRKTAAVIDTAESKSNLNISANSKLFAKTLVDVKRWSRRRCLMEKPEVKNLVRPSL